MEIHLAPDTEAQLQHLATRQGKAPAQVVEETVKRMLERRTTFLEGVQLGKDASRRGDTVSHKDVVARIDRILKP